MSGGRRSAQEKGSIDGYFSLQPHGEHGHDEGGRPEHPPPCVVLALPCDWGHHWQAGHLETQAEHSADRRTDGRTQERKDGPRVLKGTHQ